MPCYTHCNTVYCSETYWTYCTEAYLVKANLSSPPYMTARWSGVEVAWFMANMQHCKLQWRWKDFWILS